MSIDEEIEALEDSVKSIFIALTDAEKGIVMRVLSFHADKVHIKNPDLVRDIVKEIDGEVK